MNRSHGYSRKELTAVSSRATPPTPCVRRHRLHGRGIVRGNVWERTGGDAHACRLSAFAQAPFTHAVDHGAPVPSRWDEADHPVAWRARSAPCPPGRFITVLRCFSNGCLPRIFVNRSAGFSSPGMCRTVTRPAPRSSRILKSLRSTWACEHPSATSGTILEERHGAGKPHCSTVVRWFHPRGRAHRRSDELRARWQKKSAAAAATLSTSAEQQVAVPLIR